MSRVNVHLIGLTKEEMYPVTNEDDRGLTMRQVGGWVQSTLPDLIPTKSDEPGIKNEDLCTEVPLKSENHNRPSKELLKKRFQNRETHAKSQVSFAEIPTVFHPARSDPVQFPKSLQVSDSLAEPQSFVLLLRIVRKEFD